MDRLNKAAAVSLVTFSAVLAAFVGSRIDLFAVSLLFGMFIALLMLASLTLLVVIIIFRQRDDAGRERYDRPRYAYMPPSPPPYWVMPTPSDVSYDIRTPSPAPQFRAPDAAPEYVLPATQRRFYLIGESGEAQEIEASLEPSAVGDDLRDDRVRF
ncbi:MAG: hypothetical protein D6709_06875 [Chloroflexi bacterium]|jgi:hypothetical protein|uniref:Uncharacterized protein n=1 Tax=Candidatus Thermofonsia Clade 3 bacterium TaxID=2364212 RepID=A0A2M8QEB2_9CHLR|nr:hypothetical protein [Candidatus Roseilinea sp. NK_OTU-006]PJF48092.1 MAG: hypothetical protein CUN48_05160 [Candidatus Thermofonsia Clade 3 bacterium]RMG63923.1 MAG: hypothetical protein D6709_06875 [Chloroflexota bacterium]